MQNGAKKTYILDTNVLIDDPQSIFRFDEHDVIIPFEVLEELDRLKQRGDRVGQSARETIRNLERLISDGRLSEGLHLSSGGTLRFDFPTLPAGQRIPFANPYLIEKTDNRIIDLASACKQKYNGNTVLVSKDINARVKAQAMGVGAEDYVVRGGKKEEAVYTGHSSRYVADVLIRELHDVGEIGLEKLGNEEVPLLENECLLLTAPGGHSALAIRKGGRIKRIDYSHASFWGIRPKNKEQHFVFELLNDNSIPAVTLIGQAGTGKTLLSLAVGLHKTVEEGKYQRIIVTKPVVPVGRQEIGFLPGTKEAKMLPWLQSVFDNFSALSVNNHKMTIEYLKTARLLETESIAHIRGRTLARSWIIVEEAQNLTPLEIKTVLTRVGEGSKIVLTGDIDQIDSPHLDAISNGLSHLVTRFKGQGLFGHITLTRTVRSGLASLAAELL